MGNSDRTIAVVDIGATNSKVVLFDQALHELEVRKVKTAHLSAPPYAHLDAEGIVTFLKTAIVELDALHPIDKIVVSAFGATLACLDEVGELALPIMDYLAEPPEPIVLGYEAIAPAFSEVFCLPSPVALTLAKQLYWQSKAFPEQFASVKQIVPWSQYIAMRLGARASTEISALGVFTQLLDVRSNVYSSLAKEQGWDALFAPVTPAWSSIGHFKPEGNAMLQGNGNILCGIHDSNANYLRYLAAGLSRFTLLSTGTFIIGFDTHTKLEDLKPERDSFSFTDIFGRPVGCCRFFGGKEFETLLNGASPDSASQAAIESVIMSGAFALPAFSDTGGPVPGRGNKGRIVGQLDDLAEMRSALATLYVVLMTCELLDALKSEGDIILDGPFAKNALYCGLLRQLRKGQKVMSSNLQEGTAAGAAVLALMDGDGRLPMLPLQLQENDPSNIAGLIEYQTAWRSQLGA